MELKKIKSNPNNPRIIKDDKFHKLVKSISDFPEMMEKRPMVCVTDVDKKIYPLGGNMRLKALQELNYKDIPDNWVILADEWTEEKRKEFVIKDNVGFGEWDFDDLANNWDAEQLSEWSLDIPMFDKEIDYSILDSDVNDELQSMANGVKKAIQIEFEPEHYEEAFELVKFWRTQDAYVGKMILDFLKQEKEKL